MIMGVAHLGDGAPNPKESPSQARFAVWPSSGLWTCEASARLDRKLLAGEPSEE